MTGNLVSPNLASPEAQALVEIWAGLTAPQKALSAKFLYDRRGSELFEAITQLPEYYPTRCERSILEAWMPELIPSFAPGSVVELGAGSGEKTRILLSALHRLSGRRAYVPIDVSEAFLHATAQRLRVDFPRLEVIPVVGDMSREWSVPKEAPQPRLFIFLGGTIGNFAPDEAIALLTTVRQAMHPEDRFLMGVDLRKEVSVIEAAYNDAQGVTADFNLNMLSALNAQFGTTFDVAAFRHHAFYDTSLSRIEMHLVCERSHTVTVPTQGSIEIVAGESIRTEISCKQDRESVTELFLRSGFLLDELRTDSQGRFAVVEGVPIT